MTDHNDTGNGLPIITLSAKLIDADFREGYKTGYEVALADVLARCEFLLARTAALSDLRNYVGKLKDEMNEELGTAVLPHEDDYSA